MLEIVIDFGTSPWIDMVEFTLTNQYKIEVQFRGQVSQPSLIKQFETGSWDGL